MAHDRHGPERDVWDYVPFDDALDDATGHDGTSVWERPLIHVVVLGDRLSRAPVAAVPITTMRETSAFLGSP